MSEKTDKTIVSPFRDIDIRKSNPITRPDDGRITASRDHLKPWQWKPGERGGQKPSYKAVSDGLKAKLMEICQQTGKPFHELVEETILGAAIGTKGVTHTQLHALRMLLEYTEGKPKVHDDGSDRSPRIVFNAEQLAIVPKPKPDGE